MSHIIHLKENLISLSFTFKRNIESNNIAIPIYAIYPMSSPTNIIPYIVGIRREYDITNVDIAIEP